MDPSCKLKKKKIQNVLALVIKLETMPHTSKRAPSVVKDFFKASS